MNKYLFAYYMNIIKEENVQCRVCRYFDKCTLQDYSRCNYRNEKEQTWVDEENLEFWFDYFTKIREYRKEIQDKEEKKEGAIYKDSG